MESSLHARDIPEVRASTRSTTDQALFLLRFRRAPEKQSQAGTAAISHTRSCMRSFSSQVEYGRGGRADTAPRGKVRCCPMRGLREVDLLKPSKPLSFAASWSPSRGRKLRFFGISTAARLNLLVWQMPPFAATNPNQRFCTLPSRHGFRWCGTISRAGFLFPSPLRHPVSPRMRPGLLSDMVLL